MIHTGHPVLVHRRLLLLGVLAAVALDLDDEVERVLPAPAVVDEDDEVRQVAAALGAVAVRDLEAEPVVLDVGQHARVRLGDAAELGLPVLVVDHPVHVALARVGLPTWIT